MFGLPSLLSLSKDQQEQAGRVVRLILDPDVERAVRSICARENREAGTEPPEVDCIRLALTTGRSVAVEGLALFPAGPHLIHPAYSFHIWAMSTNAVGALRIGRPDKGALSWRDNRGIDFSPRLITDWYFEFASQAGEWIEVVFLK